MNDFIIVNGELYHHGVKGMKWGVRKKGYVTIRQATRNAKNAAKEARKQSLSESRATDSGIGSFRRANNKAAAAGRKAYSESIAKDKAYNKELRAAKKANRYGNDAYGRYQKGLADLKKSGRENDIEAINKLSEQYDRDRKAEKAAKKAKAKADKAVQKLANIKIKDI